MNDILLRGSFFNGLSLGFVAALYCQYLMQVGLMNVVFLNVTIMVLVPESRLWVVVLLH